MADNMGVNPFEPHKVDELVHARSIVVEFADTNLDISLDMRDVVVVSYNYSLGNWKALLTTPIADGRYYEVTHNSAKNETYLDVYEKQHHAVYKSE